jgi:serine/threonine-protein kinase
MPDRDAGTKDAPVDQDSAETVDVPPHLLDEPARAANLVDANGKKFEIFELLGRGGIGEVFRARDVELDRIVALKRLQSSSPEDRARLLAEAKHQARIDHPYVCKVFGYGELEGRPYLALQYAPDGTLAGSYRRMSLSERLRLLQRVALAVDAAHQIGLIHRDLKPSNILLEKEPDGGVIPLVADFGIARALTAEVTHSGTVVGTPAYMSPEQALGRRSVDHRTDVYALGATLYELACEHRPFQGEPTNVLLQIVDKDPPSPRTYDRSLSRDLESIIQRCLEKDPARRYPSARALADDLDRYLKGDVVVARPRTIRYRLSKWARRRRGYVALALAGALGVIVASAFAIRARVDAARRSRVAEELGSGLARIQNAWRIATLLPPHDVSPDREALAGDLAGVAELVDGAPQETEGPGRVVLARARLLLGDPDGANDELARARALGERSAAYQSALGETLLALHRRGALAAESLTGDERKQLLDGLRARYLEPAAAALARGDARSPLLAAELAFAAGRPDDALAAAARDPADPDEHVLAARVLRDRAWDLAIAGKCDDADQVAARALAEARAAREIARSLPDAWAAECAASALGPQVASCRAIDPSSAVEATAASCEAGRAIDPKREELVMIEANARNVGESVLFTLDKDPTPMIDALVKVTAEARAAFPDAVWPLTMEGAADGLLGDLLGEADKDPREIVGRGLALLKEANRRQPSQLAFHKIAQLDKTLGNWLGENGQDPTAAYDEGIAAAQQATALTPDAYFPFESLGNITCDRGTYELERGADPAPWFAQSRKAYERVLALRPNYEAAYNTLAIDDWGDGVYLAAHGGDPTKPYEAAIAEYRKTIELGPDDWLAPFNLAEALRYRGSYEVTMGRDASAYVDEGRRVLAQVLSHKVPNHDDVVEELAATDLLAARAARDDARGVSDATAQALGLLAPLEVTPRRMALRALGVAYLARVKTPLPAALVGEPAAIRAWAAGAPGPEAAIAKAALDYFAGGALDAARAAMEGAVHKSVYLRDEIRPFE